MNQKCKALPTSLPFDLVLAAGNLPRFVIDYTAALQNSNGTIPYLCCTGNHAYCNSNASDFVNKMVVRLIIHSVSWRESSCR